MQDKKRATAPVSRQRRFIKILLIFTGVILVFGGAVFFHLSLAPRRLENHLESLLQEYELGPYTMGRVQADGLTGVRISSFTLKGTDESDSSTGIHLEGLRLAGDWPAVLGGKMEIRSVYADKARIFLSRDENGRWVTGRGISPTMLADTAPVRMRVGRVVLIFDDQVSSTEEEVVVEFGPMELNTIRLSRRETRMSGALDHASLGSWHFDIIMPDDSNSLRGEITGRRISLGQSSPMFMPPPLSSYSEIANVSRGLVDMWLGFDLNILSGELSGIHANIRFSDCAMNPKGAPYPFSGVSGQLQYDGRRLEYSASGRVGSGEFQTGGYAIPETEGAFIDATVSVSGLNINDKIETAWLGGSADKLWKRIRPSGEIGGQIRLAGNVGAGRPPEVQASISFKEGRAWPLELPQPISNITAVINIDENFFVLEEGSGIYDGAAVTASGERLPVRSETPFEFSINVQNLPLSDELKQAVSSNWYADLPYGFDRLWEGLRLTGKADMDFSFVKQADAEGAISPFIDINLKDAVLAHPELPMRFTHINGRLEAGPSRISADKLWARSGEMSFEVEDAYISFGGKRTGAIQGRADNVVYGSEIRQVLPRSLIELVEKNHFHGKADIQVDVKADGDDVIADMYADISDGSISMTSFPYSITIKSGNVSLKEGRPARLDLTGAHDDSSIQVEWAESTADEPSYFKFSAERLRLDERLKDALPEWGKGVYNKMAPSGRIDVEMNAIMEMRGGEGRHTVIGEAALQNASFRPNVDLTGITGIVLFRASFPLNGDVGRITDEISLDFNLDNITIDLNEIENFVGKISSDSRKTDLIIEGGSIYGGQVSGELIFDKADKKTTVDIETNNINAAAANTHKGLGFRNIAGRLGSRIEMTTRDTMSGAAGRGWVGISNGRVGELPGGIQLAEYFRHARNDDPQLSDFRYDYRMRDGKIEITSMNFSTAEAILRGACRPEEASYQGRIIVNFTPEFLSGVEQRAAVREVIQALIRDRNIRVSFPEKWEENLWRIDPSFKLIESMLNSIRYVEGIE